MEISPRSVNENTNPFNISLITEDMKIYGPKEQQQQQGQERQEEEERNYNSKRSKNEQYNYNYNENYTNNYSYNSYNNDHEIHIQVNIHHEEYHENDLRYYLVRFKRSSQWMWLPYSIHPSSISEGDFVVCRTMNGLNIGVVIETSQEYFSSSSFSSSSSSFSNCNNSHYNNNQNQNNNQNNNQKEKENHIEIDLDSCGEIMSLATCEQMESFQGKLKKESYLLNLCREYLMDIQQDQVIRLLDVEFEMDGSLMLYYSTNESFTINQLHCLQISLKLFLSKMTFHLIRITDPSLLLCCKSINDLITCPAISSFDPTKNNNNQPIFPFNCSSSDSILSTHSTRYSHCSIILCESDSDCEEQTQLFEINNSFNF